ncbi:MAG: leucyl/phenylalanyl-tRNA--protein transferase [Spirochaetaceae bacterium]|jgi:leucyl/phenylalanyl-tRNA--protein transferase|nr:leucyl/phenylalanyl-tRNA--protein transferase [Spirochaetaceae bacterium]
MTRGGVDPDFPYLSEFERFRFPDPARIKGDIIAVGGNLSPGMLLSAYENGIFPWFNDDEPVVWQSPDPRFVLRPHNLHIPKSTEKILRRGIFNVRYNTAFEEVIQACAAVKREGQDGTWINPDMIAAYTDMRKLGYAYSAEAWREGKLAGGCYGLLLPPVFFGESMFTREDNASKIAFVSLARILFERGVRLIDCQVYTEHLARFGAVEIPRSEFLSELRMLFLR